MPHTELLLVSVVIPCFNHAQYLGEAIESVLAQTCQDFEIIVIDDGSTDATPEVARRYPEVHYLRQTNQGLSAARNAGIAASRGPYLVFLDADDRLVPEALSAGLRCIQDHGECAFVSGGHRRIDEAGAVIQQPTPPQIENDHYLALLRGNYVGMHGAVMYQRSCLVACGGFNTRLAVCEDYDLYLRLARSHSVRCHGSVVAEYRTYTNSMSANTGLMLSTALRVLRSQRKFLKQDRRRLEAYRVGVRYWQRFYAEQFLDRLPACWASGDYRKILSDSLAVGRRAAVQFLALVYLRWMRPAMLPSMLSLAARLAGRSYYPAVGRIRFGDLRRVRPISQWFGYDRGLPIDCHYLEQFLTARAGDIRGRVLEIGDAGYARRFGGDQVSRRDVLHFSDGHLQATIAGDLTAAEHIPANAFDCVISTQTLHLIYDVRSAVGTLYRILKPGGVLLLTAPGISRISTEHWGKSWYWSFTALSVRRLLEEFFPPQSIDVVAFGNVLTATGFLQGIAACEFKACELEFHDHQYEMLIAVRAAKPMESVELPPSG
ncbi:MAG: glycosyltransferase [Pirellulaceae bacterium]